MCSQLLSFFINGNTAALAVLFAVLSQPVLDSLDLPDWNGFPISIPVNFQAVDAGALQFGKREIATGQPPPRTKVNPATSIPEKFHKPSLCAMGCPSNPAFDFPQCIAQAVDVPESDERRY